MYLLEYLQTNNRRSKPFKSNWNNIWALLHCKQRGSCSSAVVSSPVDWSKSTFRFWTRFQSIFPTKKKCLSVQVMFYFRLLFFVEFFFFRFVIPAHVTFPVNKEKKFSKYLGHSNIWVKLASHWYVAYHRLLSHIFLFRNRKWEKKQEKKNKHFYLRWRKKKHKHGYDNEIIMVSWY